MCMLTEFIPFKLFYTLLGRHSPMFGLGAVKKQEGRPMVWETCKVCNEANHSWFASFLLPLLPTNLQNTPGHVPRTHLHLTKKPHSPMTSMSPHNSWLATITPQKSLLSQFKWVQDFKSKLCHGHVDGQHELDHDPKQQHKDGHKWHTPSYLVFSSPVKSSFFPPNEANGNRNWSRPFQIFRDCNRTLKDRS